MQGWQFWTVAVLVAFIVGFSKGGWSAIGNLSVPILSLVISPLSAAGLLLPVYLVSDWFGLWAYRHSYDRRVLSILIPAGLLGVGLGWAIIPFIDTRVPGGERIVTGVVGLIGTVFSFFMLYTMYFKRSESRPPREPKIAPGLFWAPWLVSPATSATLVRPRSRPTCSPCNLIASPLLAQRRFSLPSSISRSSFPIG